MPENAVVDNESQLQSSMRPILWAAWCGVGIEPGQYVFFFCSEVDSEERALRLSREQAGVGRRSCVPVSCSSSQQHSVYSISLKDIHGKITILNGVGRGGCNRNEIQLIDY